VRQAEKAVKSISASFESVLREAHTFAETERALALESRNATEEAVASELARLKAQNAGLVRALEQERQRSDRAQTDLVQRVAGLVSDFAADREQSMREVLGAVENANSEAAVQLANYQAAQTSRMEDAAKRGKTWAGSLEKTGVELKRSRDGSIKVSSCWRLCDQGKWDSHVCLVHLSIVFHREGRACQHASRCRCLRI
jgi:kinesin family member 11